MLKVTVIFLCCIVFGCCVCWRDVHVAVCLCVLQIFERILFIWAIRHPASGYVQGINDLVTPFFVVFLSEFISNGTYFSFSLLKLIYCSLFF